MQETNYSVQFITLCHDQCMLYCTITTWRSADHFLLGNTWEITQELYDAYANATLKENKTCHSFHTKYNKFELHICILMCCNRYNKITADRRK